MVATGNDVCGRCQVSDWSNVVAISAGVDHTLGLKADGTVCIKGYLKTGVSEVLTWRDMVAVSAGYECCLGLRADGTVLAAGKSKLSKQMLEGLNLFSSIPPAEREKFIQHIIRCRSTVLE